MQPAPPAPPTSTALRATFDLTRATPGLHTYQAGYVLADGSRHDCEGTCRFTVRDVVPRSWQDPGPFTLASDKVSSAITLKALRRPTGYVLSGRVTPTTQKQKVTLAQVRGTAVVGMVSTPVRADGTFSATVALRLGTVRLMALTAATPVRAAGRSPVTVVTVR